MNMRRRSQANTRVTSGTYNWFQQEVGRFLTRLQNLSGFTGGANPATWSFAELEQVHQLIEQGEHDAYHVPGHTWSFLRPEFTLTTVADDYDYTQGVDFGGVVNGSMFYSPDDNGYTEVRKITPQAIRARRAVDVSVSSFPIYFAEEVRTTDGSADQTWHLLLWPTPSDAYTLRGVYRVEPVYMSESRQYPYGGPAFRNVLLQAILARAEQDFTGQAGVQTERYSTLLAEAIQRDGTAHGAWKLGYNGNRRTARSGMRDGRWFENFDNVTYEGTEYGG